MDSLSYLFSRMFTFSVVKMLTQLMLPLRLSNIYNYSFKLYNRADITASCCWKLLSTPVSTTRWTKKEDSFPACPKCTKKNDAVTAAVNYSAAATPAEHSGFFSGPDFGQKSNDISRLCHILYFCEQGPINLPVIDPKMRNLIFLLVQNVQKRTMLWLLQ